MFTFVLFFGDLLLRKYLGIRIQILIVTAWAALCKNAFEKLNWINY